MAEKPKTAFETYLKTFARRKFTFALVFLVALIGTGLLTLTVKQAYQTNSLVAIAEVTQMRMPDFLDVYLPGASTIALSGDTYVALLEGLPMADRIAARLADEGIFVTGKAVGFAMSAEFFEPDMIEITARAPDSLRAIALANAAAETFVEENRESIRRELSRASYFIEEELVVAEQEWLAAQDALAEFREKEQMSDLDSWATEMMTKAAEYQHRLRITEVDIEGFRAKRAELESLLRGDVVCALNPMEDPVVLQLQETLSQVETATALARSEYAPGHPEIAKREARLKELRALMQERIEQCAESPQPIPDKDYYLTLRRDLAQTEVMLIGGEAEKKALANALAETHSDLASIPGKQLEYQRLELLSSVAEDKYRTLMERLQAARIQAGGVQGNASVIDLAVDARPTTSSGKLLVYAFVFSLILGIASVFVVEYLDDTLKTTEEVSSSVKLTPLGAIPRVRQLEKRLLSPGDQKSPLFESYRILRSGVRFASVRTPIHSLQVTSSIQGEGKSSTAVNLAVVMAAGGERVLLVDADLRNPTLHRLLGIEPEKGITSVLLGEADLDEVIIDTPYENLRVLPCGPVPPNPVELFESQGMKDLVEKLKGCADLVIFDSAPALPVTDAALLATNLDAVIVVLGSGEVTIEDSQSAKRILEGAGARVIGGILNKVRRGAFDGYYGRYPHSGNDGQKGTGGGAGRLGRAVNELTARITGRQD